MDSNAARFWVLGRRRPGDIDGADTEFLEFGSVNMGEAPRCPKCGLFVGMLEWLPPYQVQLICRGEKFGDLVYGAGLDVLVSDGFRQLYMVEGLTGLTGFDPVEVVKIRRRKRNRSTPPHYFRAAPVRSSAGIDLTASGCEWEPPPTCDACRVSTIVSRWRRIVIETGTWSGEDVFVARGLPGTVLASERFMTVCKRHGVLNALLLPAEEYSKDFYPLGKSGQS